VDLAHVAALRAEEAATVLSDPVQHGKVDCLRIWTFPRERSWDRRLTTAERAADALEPHARTPLSLQVLGMLTLHAALGAAVSQRPQAISHWLGEADRLAARVPDDLQGNWQSFSQTNVNLWRVAIGVERGESGGAVLGLARNRRHRGQDERVQIMQPGAGLADPLAPYAQVSRARPDGGCWVMANMVGGLDGSAAIGGRVAALSTAPDRELFTLLRALADVVLAGAQTVRREGYRDIRLPAARVAARQAAGRPDVPRLAVVTRSLDLDWSSPAFSAPPAASRPLVITCEAAGGARLERAAEHAEVMVAGQDRVDLAQALAGLAGRGHRVVLCEGGPTLLGELVAIGRLDELCLTIAPVMGGDPLPVSIAPAGAPLRHFALRHVLCGDGTLFLRYDRAGDSG
jgi:riboflavin biosynthesis pyrimidine reductase